MAEKSSIKDAYLPVIISIVASVAVSMIILGINKTDQAAPKDYVDKKMELMERQISTKVSKEDFEVLNARIVVIDARIYDLWKLSNKDNK